MVGAHRFCLRHWGWGTAYVLFSWTFIPFAVALVECVSIRERTENYSKVGMKAAAVVTEKEAFNAEIYTKVLRRGNTRYELLWQEQIQLTGGGRKYGCTPYPRRRKDDKHLQVLLVSGLAPYLPAKVRIDVFPERHVLVIPKLGVWLRVPSDKLAQEIEHLWAEEGGVGQLRNLQPFTLLYGPPTKCGIP
jgi:hypothetical protein